MKYHKFKHSYLLTLSSLIATCLSSPADTFLLTGTTNIEDGASWTNTADSSTGVLPGPGDIALIQTDATVGSGNFDTFMDEVTINHTAGVLSGRVFNFNSPGAVYNLSGGGLTVTQNLFANERSIFNLSGGTITLVGPHDLIAISGGGFNLSGNARISMAHHFDLRLHTEGAFLNIDPSWSGSLISGADSTESDWIAELVFGAVDPGSEGSVVAERTISVGGIPITDENFANFFLVTPDGNGGSSLTLNVTRPLALGAPFKDRMVLQRDKPINIWGTTSAGDTVNISIAGHNVSGIADGVGKWKVEIPATPAGGGSLTLQVTSSGQNGSDSLTVDNVVFGDVWFCFGQSNMETSLQQSNNTEWPLHYIDGINSNNDVRCMFISREADLVENDDIPNMNWFGLGGGAQSWPAVAGVFAYQLNQATDVPVGILWASRSASSIEGWMPRKLANSLPHFKDMLTNYQSMGEYNLGQVISPWVPKDNDDAPLFTNEEYIDELVKSGGYAHNIFMRTRPNIIYNQMVYPLHDYGIAGFVWYQGEANAGTYVNVAQYRYSLPLMVEEYRKRFGQGDLPFLGVQLPSRVKEFWPWFRGTQQEALQSIPNAYVAVSLDTGALDNEVHPKDKEAIGVRLSLLAREHALGENIEGDSPRYASHVINGDQVILSFDHADGLTTKDNASPAGFHIAGADGIFHEATSATITANTITVSSTAVTTPVHVRYAWFEVTKNVVNVINNAPQPNGSPFFTDTGLPMAPFRTDSLPIPQLGVQTPVGNKDTYSVPGNTLLDIPASGVLSNDFDLNMDSLNAILVDPPANGTLELVSDGSFTYNPEDGFSGVDSFTYVASEASGDLNSPPVIVTIIVEEGASNYDNWRQSISWDAGDDGTINGDPDGDGISNFLEFAFALDPLVSSLDGLPRIVSVDDDFATYDFKNAQEGLLYEIQTSTDLLNWSSPPFVTLTKDSTTPVQIPTTEESEGNLFLRIKVSSE